MNVVGHRFLILGVQTRILMSMTRVEDACIRNGVTVDADLAEGGEKARDRLRHRAASSYFQKQCKTGK